mgnify:CR=1 FL=1
MKRENIEKVADEFANKEYEISDIDRIPLYKGFYHGAEWRINSVWHNASEKPDTDKGDLLVIVKDAFGKDVYVRQNAYYVLKYGCVRWAYIKDLIPNMED